MKKEKFNKTYIYLAFCDSKGRNFATQVCLSEESALEWLYERWIANVLSIIELYRATLDENKKVVEIEKAIQLFTDSKASVIEWKVAQPETKRILKREIEGALKEVS